MAGVSPVAFIRSCVEASISPMEKYVTLESPRPSGKNQVSRVTSHWSKV